MPNIAGHCPDHNGIYRKEAQGVILMDRSGKDWRFAREAAPRDSYRM
jgi:hypothetical protein